MGGREYNPTWKIGIWDGIGKEDGKTEEPVIISDTPVQIPMMDEIFVA